MVNGNILTDFVDLTMLYEIFDDGYWNSSYVWSYLESNLYYSSTGTEQLMKDAGAVFLTLNQYRYRFGYQNYNYDPNNVKCETYFQSSNAAYTNEYGDYGDDYGYYSYPFWVDYQDCMVMPYSDDNDAISEGFYVRLIRDLN